MNPMTINEMTSDECSAVLVRASFGRLGCSLKDQAYVVPIYLVYDASYFYALSTEGRKIEWMRKNPKVCVQVDEFQGESNWVSVIAYGEYQELTEPQFTQERNHARHLLEKRPSWWQTALAERELKAAKNIIDPLFFRIHVVSTTGLRASD
jgi:hypothetical protein